jgi:hypothetical protein
MRLAVAVAAALTLSACTTAPLLSPSSEVLAVQGDTSLDAAYNAAAQVYLAELPTMPAPTKATLKPMMVRAYALVQAADTGTLLTGETTVAGEITDAETLIAQVKAAL